MVRIQTRTVVIDSIPWLQTHAQHLLPSHRVHPFMCTSLYPNLPLYEDASITAPLLEQPKDTFSQEGLCLSWGFYCCKKIQ